MSDSQLTAAYATCRGIARREARNFYYSFLALPREKRNALSAVYAFMRHADDISDDETQSAVERLRRLCAWQQEWREVLAGKSTSDPVFVALADAQKRFTIPAQLLDQLVQGTSMDLQPAEEHAPEQKYAQAAATAVLAPVRVLRSFDDLYRYCYLVASVVGLVCIRIYGYDNAHAEPLAERCGVAFQLTNIIRDIKEDAELGRVYLPEEDLAKFGLSTDDFLTGGGSRLSREKLSPLLKFEAQRAREYYTSADELLPLIHRDSRSALWVMTTIYRRLLERIATSGFDVLNRRIRLSAGEKLSVLGRGLAKSMVGKF